MGKRTTARRLAMQAIYQAEAVGIDIEAAYKNIVSAEQFIPATTDFAAQLARAAWAERAELDKIINEFSIDWPLDRLGKVDHSILRLALSELKAGATPVSVIIDEAVELAKKYSGNESAKFINGILGAFLRKA